MKKLLIIILLLIPFTVQAWFADKLEDAFTLTDQEYTFMHETFCLWWEEENQEQQKQVEEITPQAVNAPDDVIVLLDEECTYFDWQRYPQKCWKRDEIGTLVSHNGFGSEYHDSIMSFAYYIWGKDFLLTLNAENWWRDKDKLSNIVWANWYRDQWLCQLNRKYHLPFILSDDFKDPYKQIRYCFDVYSDAVQRGKIKTTFYWYNHRFTRDNGFIYKQSLQLHNT